MPTARFGPPFPGAPWMGRERRFRQRFGVQSDTDVPIAARPYVGRLRRHHNEEERVRRAVDELATIANSLLATSQLIMTGQQQFEIRSGAFTSDTAPSANADRLHGYAVGALWVNTTTQAVYICVSNLNGAAVWTELT